VTAEFKTLAEKYAERHASTVQLLFWLEPSRRPSPPIEALVVLNQVALVADRIVEHCPDGAELFAGLRKLLEAKDCFVRAVLSRPGSVLPGHSPVR